MTPQPASSRFAIEVSMKSGPCRTVVTAMETAPSAKAGMLVRDKSAESIAMSTDRMDLQEARSNVLQGPRRKSRLTLLRPVNKDIKDLYITIQRPR